MTEDPTAKAFAHITATVDKDLMKDYPNARQPATPEAVSATATTPAQEVTMVATATLKADQVRRNAFTENLGKDEFVAVDDLGNVIARSDRATLERDYPHAHFFGAKDFGGNAAASKTKSDDTPVQPVYVNPPPGIPTTLSGHPVADALADDPTPEPGTRTHPLDDGTPYEGPQAVEPTDPSLNQIAKAGGTPVKDALAASHAANTEAENAGRHAKTDELQAEQVKALEADGVFDHDGNGKPGGSKKGKDSTAAKGAERKRKPAAK